MPAHLSRVSMPLALVIAAAVVALMGSAPTSAGGPTLVVDTTADDPTLFACGAASGDCSLRGAITTANGISTHNVIQLASGATYVLDEAGTFEDTNATGDLDVLAPITLEGNGSTIDANAIDRVFDVNIPASETALFDSVTITGGVESGNGGAGIRMNLGQLTLDHSTVTENTSDVIGLAGAGIITSGDANTDILSSTLSFNTATHEFGSGGAFAKPDGTGSIEFMGSRVDHNTAGSTAGGVYIGLSPGGATFVNSDVTNNTSISACDPPSAGCFFGGGGVYAGAETVSFFDGSVSNNHSGASAGGVYVPNIQVSGTKFELNTAGSMGGAILSFSDEGRIVDAIITNNEAGFGGGLAFGGELSHSTVAFNQATQHGGGVLTQYNLFITHSTIFNNTAGGEGGGVAFADHSPRITNSTISGNTASVGGGIARNGTISSGASPFPQPQGQGVTNPGPLTITHATIANNTATTGSNVKPLAAMGDIVVRSSIIADPVGGQNCSGVLSSDGFNVEDADTCGLHAFNDAVNVDALLLNLADNGGAGPTHGLDADSPAIDRALVCPPPSTDQRDETRPRGNACDSGAFESEFVGPTATPVETLPPTSTPTAPATATPTAPPTATPVVTPTGTPQGDQRKWGDSDCDGEISSRDNQALLRKVLSQNALSQSDPCPDLGHVLVQPPLAIWGDWDCDGEISSRDNQALLRNVLSQTPLTQTDPCPEIGTTVETAG